jgi:integrase
MSAITRMEAQRWVAELRETRLARYRGRVVRDGDDAPFLSAETIHATVHVMSSLFRAAMKEHPPVVLANPFAELELPVIEPRPVDSYEPDEAAALYEAIGELAGLHGHRVDWLRSRLAVVDVMTRQGLRQHPKSKRSHRVVPVPAATLEGMSVLLAGRERDGLVFTAPQGGPISDRHFANRIWFPAVAAAGVRRFPPRIMRHAAASWLEGRGIASDATFRGRREDGTVRDGRRTSISQMLSLRYSTRLVNRSLPVCRAGFRCTTSRRCWAMSRFATTQRYAHLAPDAHSRGDRVVESALWRTSGAWRRG